MINVSAILASIESYTKGKTWYWYILPWVFGLYLFIKLLSFDLNTPLPFFISIAHAFDFMLHEMSHLLTAFLPQILTAASGSLSELLLGGLLIFGAFKTRTYFASLFCFLWFMLACFSVANYMGDARAQNLQLVSLGNGFSSSENVIHDWNYIFSKLGLLNLDTAFANALWLVGLVSGVFGLAFSAYIIFKIYANSGLAAMSNREAQLLQNTKLRSGFDDPTTEVYKQKHANSIYPEPSKGRMADSVESSKNKY